ncbi:Myosin regulatory light chain 1 [Neolecta irregularis DAH-3]|uniref:Myosin regulatory light chain 1 n=1 Tax=Neolecta irregularis (strain DAH-3) TaxID=1198029 RepID=A0A1U7LH53_NEOID|nr:Myosin regulatory light chain 1 [Neolecta irregularis DAH-3]|eukprot:OLL21986.1 Myosin regulatory light chain 1 [Neolecta irregularis DAH-3]
MTNINTASRSLPALPQRAVALAAPQLQQLREAFHCIDKDADGIISFADLRQILSSLGHSPTDNELNSMLSLLPSPVNFAAYLTAMSAHLSHLSARDNLLNAFAAFDDSDSGKADLADLKDALINEGNRMTPSDVDAALAQFADLKSRKHTFHYRSFVDILAGSEGNDP